MIKFTKKHIIYGIVLFLSACAGNKPITVAEPTKKIEINQNEYQVALRLINNGDTENGIKLFKQSIKDASPKDHNRALLTLSETLYDNNYLPLFKNYFAQIQTALLSDEYKNNYQILIAAQQLLDSQAKQAIITINNTVDSRDTKYTSRKLKLLIQSYRLVNRPIEEVQSRILYNLVINNDDIQHQNEIKIWAILSTLPISDLLIEQDNNSSEYQSWIQYSLIARQLNTQSVAYLDAITNWTNDNLQHSSLAFITQIDENFKKQQRPPNKIAIILPITGKYKSISNSILNGFFASYYRHIQQHPEQTSEIMLYDSAKASNSIWLIYNQAKQDQADLIIGPLQKHYIDQLLSSPILPVPVITLNYSNQNRESANRFELIEFGLRPEDEANQIATASAQHNYLKTIAIVPRSNFGQKMLTTYQQKIEQFGGKILAHEKYSRKQKDFSSAIKQLTGINKSQSRFNRLKQITGEKFVFEPRIRQDIDNIFLVSNSKQAKLIIPQFKFFHAGGLPIFANSQVYSKQSKKYSDLNDIKFTTPPWTFTTNNKTTQKRYQNFNALGQDSFNILSHLSRIKRNPNYTFNGAIGAISINDVGQLHRKLEWATIKRGKLTKLDINAIK